MDKIKVDMLQYSELKLVGYINGEEVNLELDKSAKIMLMGYLNKKKLVHK